MDLKQPYKLNDLQNRPLVVLCSFLLGLVAYLVIDREKKQDIYRTDTLDYQAKIDSINREQIILYRDLAFKDRVINEQEKIIVSSDSVFTEIKQSAKQIIQKAK